MPHVTTKSFNSWIQKRHKMWQHVEKVSSDHRILMWHKVRKHCCRMPCLMEVRQSNFLACRLLPQLVLNWDPWVKIFSSCMNLWQRLRQPESGSQTGKHLVCPTYLCILFFWNASNHSPPHLGHVLWEKIDLWTTFIIAVPILSHCTWSRVDSYLCIQYCGTSVRRSIFYPDEYAESPTP